MDSKKNYLLIFGQCFSSERKAPSGTGLVFDNILFFVCRGCVRGAGSGVRGRGVVGVSPDVALFARGTCLIRRRIWNAILMRLKGNEFILKRTSFFVGTYANTSLY